MEQKEVLVSIIVPVYKTEKYLDECVQSILKQDYPALEILLIDDGSPDNCPALCDDYASRYENVKVIHQENKGLGLSRNTGMDAATGKYLFFIDSDDCLDGPGAIRMLVEEAQQKQADITVGCYRRFNDSGFRQINRHHLHGGEWISVLRVFICTDIWRITGDSFTERNSWTPTISGAAPILLLRIKPTIWIVMSISRSTLLLRRAFTSTVSMRNR